MLFLDATPRKSASTHRQISASKSFGSVLVCRIKSLSHGDCYENNPAARDFPKVLSARQPRFDWSVYHDFWMTLMKNLPRRETSWIKFKLKLKAFNPAWIATLMHIWRFEGVCDFIGVFPTHLKMEKIIQTHRTMRIKSDHRDKATQ